GMRVALSQSRASVPADIHSVQSSSAKNPGKHAGLHAEPFKIWIAEPTVPVLGTVWRKRVCELNELLRIGHRQKAQNDRIQQTEDSCRRTNPQRQRENRNRGEARALPQGAKAEAQILGEVFDEVNAPGVAAFLFGALDAAKLNPRLPHRFRVRHSAAHQILSIRLHVKADRKSVV